MSFLEGLKTCQYAEGEYRTFYTLDVYFGNRSIGLRKIMVKELVEWFEKLILELWHG